jgi:hypothetical protein
MSGDASGNGVKIFVSYAHLDSEPFHELLDATKSARAGGLTWNDLEIIPGDNWDAEIARNLDSADLVLPLLSANFLSSKFCVGVEMRRALARHANGDARVVPILLAPCDWRSSRFAAIQGLPSGMKALSDWPDRAEGLRNVAQGVELVVAQLAKQAELTRLARDTYDELAGFRDAQLLRMIDEIKFSISIATERLAPFSRGTEPFNLALELAQLKRKLFAYESEFRRRDA